MDWATLIGSYAFPIVACVAMAWYCKDTSDKNREDTKELNKQHSEEMMAFKDEIKVALNNNTIALTKLCEKLDKDERREENEAK